MFVDTHCHLTDEKLLRDIKIVVEGFKQNGVSKVIDIGCDLQSSCLAFENSKRFNEVYFAVGVHPSEVDGFEDSVLSELSALSKDNKCVAIGEIGLDFHYLPYDEKKQTQIFIKQLELAYENKLPVSIHVRDCMGQALRVLKDNKSKLAYGGVMHCYSGSKETSKELLDLGLYIAFGGTLTFKNARNLLEVSRCLPLDRILTETDSPYLAPEGLRGTVNTPKNIPIIVNKLAEIKGVDINSLAEIILNNATTCFPKLKN